MAALSCLWALVSIVLMANEVKSQGLVSCADTPCQAPRTCRIVRRCDGNHCQTGARCVDFADLPASNEPNQCTYEDPVLSFQAGEFNVIQCGTNTIESGCPTGTYCNNTVCCAGAPKTTGRCPPKSKFSYRENGSCSRFCQHDGECPGFQLCCSSGPFCTTCVDPVPDRTCETVQACGVGKHCVMAAKDCPSYPCLASPECVADKAGECPNLQLNACVDQCKGDSHCPGNKKCCGAGGCNVCVSPKSATPTGSTATLTMNSNFLGLTGNENGGDSLGTPLFGLPGSQNSGDSLGTPLFGLPGSQNSGSSPGTTQGSDTGGTGNELFGLTGNQNSGNSPGTTLGPGTGFFGPLTGNQNSLGFPGTTPGTNVGGTETGLSGGISGFTNTPNSATSADDKTASALTFPSSASTGQPMNIGSGFKLPPTFAGVMDRVRNVMGNMPRTNNAMPMGAQMIQNFIKNMPTSNNAAATPFRAQMDRIRNMMKNLPPINPNALRAQMARIRSMMKNMPMNTNTNPLANFMNSQPQNSPPTTDPVNSNPAENVVPNAGDKTSMGNSNPMDNMMGAFGGANFLNGLTTNPMGGVNTGSNLNNARPQFNPQPNLDFLNSGTDTGMVTSPQDASTGPNMATNAFRNTAAAYSSGIGAKTQNQPSQPTSSTSGIFSRCGQLCQLTMMFGFASVMS